MLNSEESHISEPDVPNNVLSIYSISTLIIHLEELENLYDSRFIGNDN